MDCLILSDQGMDCLLSLCSTGSGKDQTIEVTSSGTEDMNACSLNSNFSDNKPTQASDPGCESLIDELLQWCSPCDDEDSHFTQGMFLNSCDVKDSLGGNNDHYFDQLLDLGENSAQDQQSEAPCIFSNSNGSQESEHLINCELDLFDCDVLEELMDVKCANPFTCFNSIQKNSENAGHRPEENSNCLCSCLGSPYPNLGKKVIPSHKCSLKGEAENLLCVPEVHRGYGGDFSPHLFSPTRRQHNFMNNPNEYLHDCLPSFTPMFSLSQPGSPFSVHPSSAKNALGFNCSPQNNEIPLPFNLLLEQNEHNSLVNFTKEMRVNDSSSFCSWKQGLSVQNSRAHADNDESDVPKSKSRRISVLAMHSEIHNMLKERSQGKTYGSSLLRSKNASQCTKNLCNKNNQKPNTTKDIVQKGANISVAQSVINTCLKKNIIWTVGKRDKLIKVNSKAMRKFAVRDLLKISGNWEYKTMKEETRELREERDLLLQKKKERLRELNKVGQNI